jgi:SAM-dependent methyltransferase
MEHGSTIPSELKERILAENRKVHARENALYLPRHPEQTNFYQSRILENMLNRVCGHLPSPQSKILDLGCGTGYFYLPLLARGYRMRGVDLSDDLIRVLDGLIPPHLRANSKLETAEALEFAERDSTQYDAVVISALLHHLFDYEQAVKTWSRKLKPGGVLLVFFEPLKQAIASPLRFALHTALSRLEETFYKIEMSLRRIPLFEDDYHLSDYQRQFGGIDPNRLIETLEAEGLEVLALEKYCARRYGLSALIANHLLGTQNTFNLLMKKPA